MTPTVTAAPTPTTTAAAHADHHPDDDEPAAADQPRPPTTSEPAAPPTLAVGLPLLPLSDDPLVENAGVGVRWTAARGRSSVRHLRLRATAASSRYPADALETRQAVAEYGESGGLARTSS